MISRRRFLASASALVLAACAGDRRTFDLGGSSDLSIWNWADYIDPSDDGLVGTVDRFRAETGIDVGYDTSYEDNAAAFDDVISPGLSGVGSLRYDIIVPTFWLAAQMLDRGWLEAIPLEIVPNHVNIDPSFLTPAWDRGARFNMPWQAGITGIAYNPALTGGRVPTVTDLFESRFDSGVGMVREMRETLGLTMLVDGADPTRPTFDAAMVALDRIEAAAASGQVSRFTSFEFADGLASGELAAAMAWSGDIVQLQRDRPDIEFVIPEEGAIQWFDTMVIPAGSSNIAAAGKWMDFVYDPANAAQITSWVQYISPVLGVRDELVRMGGESAALAENQILFPDAVTRQRLFTWGSMVEDEEAQVESRFAAIIGEGE
ncbi:MAG: spermidine/putrescine ABC transporter substrate-binding protein [Actinomycetia bacterium]|nr:spermidine/putrescine ABC transporter substrate-binding protein [Actinomycetes bacterium]MCP4958339.1 spermidine/putrescine ABC transporter substrate-binding protein [Actinomycetes bacterium]